MNKSEVIAAMQESSADFVQGYRAGYMECIGDLKRAFGASPNVTLRILSRLHNALHARLEAERVQQETDAQFTDLLKYSHAVQTKGQ